MVGSPLPKYVDPAQLRKGSHDKSFVPAESGHLGTVRYRLMPDESCSTDYGNDSIKTRRSGGTRAQAKRGRSRKEIGLKGSRCVPVKKEV